MKRLHPTTIDDHSWRRMLRRILRLCGGELMIDGDRRVMWIGLGGRRIKAPLPVESEGSLNKFVRKLRARGYKL